LPSIDSIHICKRRIIPYKAWEFALIGVYIQTNPNKNHKSIKKIKNKTAQTQFFLINPKEASDSLINY